MKGAIDIVVNLFTPFEVANKQTGFDANFTSQVRMAEHMKTGVSIEDYLLKMDKAGIERSRPIFMTSLSTASTTARDPFAMTTFALSTDLGDTLNSVAASATVDPSFDGSTFVSC